MNILYLAHRIPFPPTKGDKLRAFRHIDRLRRSHRVWCACFVDDSDDERWVGPLRAYCHELAAIRLPRRRAFLRGAQHLLRGGTMTEGFYAHREMTEALDKWNAICRFDVVVAFSSSMVQYALKVPSERRVMDLCDCDSQKWLEYARRSRGPKRWAYEREGNRLAKIETKCLDEFDATIVISESEAASLRGRGDDGRLHVLTNGVELPRGHVEAPLSPPVQGPKRPSPLVVGFLGVMDYRPNVDAVIWFVRECWPDLRLRHPTAEFRIAGRNPVRAVRRLDRVPGVKVVGGVNDIWTELCRWRVSVAPLRIARGLQNKVLESMAAAKPVVLTSAAADGIAGRDGEEFLVADRSAEIVDHVSTLLSDDAECQRIGRAARDFVARHHRWEDVLNQFELLVTGGIERSESRKEIERVVTHEKSSPGVESITVAGPQAVTSS